MHLFSRAAYVHKFFLHISFQSQCNVYSRSVIRYFTLCEGGLAFDCIAWMWQVHEKLKLKPKTAQNWQKLQKLEKIGQFVKKFLEPVMFYHLAVLI